MHLVQPLLSSKCVNQRYKDGQCKDAAHAAIPSNLDETFQYKIINPFFIYTLYFWEDYWDLLCKVHKIDIELRASNWYFPSLQQGHAVNSIFLSRLVSMSEILITQLSVKVDVKLKSVSWTIH